MEIEDGLNRRSERVKEIRTLLGLDLNGWLLDMG
jgi:hypothetical protein